ncbi:hypothetical protein CASFOL_029293 [Castilleja foliolosa]|uniref:Uncharacterized protein n=1 Tax=Castilleja foliolosa TaxID=1961234 RepID=A0ABD3CAQ9_9LAMI
MIKKRRKEAFFSKLGKTPSSQSVGTTVKVGTSGGEAPAWAPLRDNYMLTNPKLKDWDKIDINTFDDFWRQSGQILHQMMISELARLKGCHFLCRNRTCTIDELVDKYKSDDARLFNRWKIISISLYFVQPVKAKLAIFTTRDDI